MFRPLFATLALTLPLSAGLIFQTFEGDGFDGWTAEGAAFGLTPVAGKSDEIRAPFISYANESLAASTHGGAAAKGMLTSPEFTIAEESIVFLIAGGDQSGKTAVQLVVGGKVVREAVGKRKMLCEKAFWDVRDLIGSKATIRLVDDADGDWGFIGVDHIVFTDSLNDKFPSPTRSGQPFVEGLVKSTVIPDSSIPLDSVLKIEATHEELNITSPTALTFDEQGRVYVSETHRYREGIEDDRSHLYWYLDDLAAKTTKDRRALHEKWKEKVSIEHMTKKSEVIRRLADTDGDGKLDETKVYADGFNDVLDGTAAGVFYYEGSLYFACIPKLYMLRDTNGDGVADERKTVEEGFGVRVSLSGHDLNGFTLGPDGRIYGTVGDRGLSLITKDGVTYDYPNEGAAFRFEPDGTGFELFHTGLRNPKEIAFDALGNAFTVDNNSDQGDAARVVYLVEGGDSGWQMEHQAMHTFHRQIGLEERPPSRWMDERMWELKNDAQPAYILPPEAHLSSGPSGLTYHPGAGFLESEFNRFLVCDYRGGAANSGIWSFEMKPKGAGMEMTDSRQFLWGVAATDVEYSWDGKVFVTDFITGWKSHAAGRLLSLNAGEKTWQKIESDGAAKIMKDGFEHRSSAVLLNFLRHPDFRIRLRAQLALTRKSDALSRFNEATISANPTTRVHGVWGLSILARRSFSPLPSVAFGEIPDAKTPPLAEKALIALLKDKDAEIRAQALRGIADAKTQPQQLPLGPLLADALPRVRYFAAMTVGKRKLIGYYSDICDLITENNNRDLHLRHAGIFALQNIASKPAILTSLVASESPALRLAAVVALRRLKNPSISLFLRDPDPKVADEAIRAICDQDLVAQRPMVATLLDDLSVRAWSPFMLRRLIHNAYRNGTKEDAANLIKVAADPALPEIVRKEAFRLLTEWVEPFPADQLTGHWRPLDKRDTATVKPVILAALPALLKQEGFALTAALKLAAEHRLDVPALDEKSLRTMIETPALPAAARSIALELVLQKKPKDSTALLTKLASDPSDDVALSALSALVQLSPATALPLLDSAIASGSPSRIRKTWAVISKLPDESVDSIFVKNLEALRAANGISPHALELIAAAKKRTAAAVANALAEFEKSLAESSDPLAKWNSTLTGGDPQKGAEIFSSHPASQCMRCHRASEGHSAGGETAPNLAGIAKRHPDPRYLLESMVLPSATITYGFGAVLVDFKNGATLTGNVLAETPEHLDIIAAGKFLRISRADIANITTPASPMPPMGDVLKLAELRDLVAWLATLDQGGEAVKATTEPTLLDPATLLTTPTPAAVDPAVMKSGQAQYILCVACHGQSGEGTSVGPPLAGSEWVNGPPENLIRIQLRGLTGPITVKGQHYNIPGGMQPLASQNDDQIAAVLTYVRNSFGNSAPAVTAAQVAALRGEVGKPQLTAAELTPPEPQETSTPLATAAPGKYDQLTKESPTNKWIAIAIGIFVIGALAQGIRLMKR